MDIAQYFEKIRLYLETFSKKLSRRAGGAFLPFSALLKNSQKSFITTYEKQLCTVPMRYLTGLQTGNIESVNGI